MDDSMTQIAAGSPHRIISVIITNFNYAAFVGQAISSVLAQTYPHVECIVVDDGSTDRSREVIDSYDGIKKVFQANSGQAQAGRTGLMHVSGSIVIFLDSDDYLLPEACDAIAASWSTGVAAVLYRLRVWRGDNNTEEVLPSRSFITGGAKEFIAAYGYLPAAPMSGNAYSDDVVRQIFAGGLHMDKNGLDAYLILCSPFLGTVVAIDKPLGVYRIHSANISMYAKRTLRSLKSQIYYEYWAQRSAAKFSSRCSIEPSRWDFLKGAYNLKWYIMAKQIKCSEFDIPEYPLRRCVRECCREFVFAPDITLSKRLINCLLICTFAVLPRATKTFFFKLLYRLDVPKATD
jgi:glycosyltransferase involved in cell wall biosynthesis